MPRKLEAIGLVREAGGTRIVDGADLAVDEGEVVAVVGPSGAGKSSLLRLLNRLDEPSDGVVLLDGDDARRMDPTELRRRVGLVPQDPSLWPGTALENVTLASRLRDEDPDLDRARDLLEDLGLGGLADRDAGDLSGGEAQRVALARTLYNEPEVLLLDEPTANLDPGSREEVEDAIADLVQDRRLTAVLVTHDHDQARRLADRVVEMDEGVLDSPLAREEPA